MAKIQPSKTLEFFAILFILLVVSLTLFSPIPAREKLIIRIILLVVFAVLWILFHKKGLAKAKDLAFALLALNLAFFIVSFFTPAFWHLNPETSAGFALIKLSDAAILSLVLILSFLMGGYKLKSIYLTTGRLIPGLAIGILVFILLGYLAINNPQQRISPEFLSRNFAWILIFVLANGFMEELLFRGIFLQKLNGHFKPVWSIVLTSLCFAAPHLTVQYAPDVLLFCGIVFVLGMICGFAMHCTKSILAPMLIHAGADLLIILQVFAAYDVVG